MVLDVLGYAELRIFRADTALLDPPPNGM